MDKEELKSNVSKPDIWVRGIHMLILFIALRISELILYGLIIFQYGMELITGGGNENLDKVAKNLSHYIKNIFLSQLQRRATTFSICRVGRQYK